MTPSQILAIPVNQPWRLFSNPSVFKDTARELRRAWHPNLNHDPQADKVMAHINVLIDAWEDPANRTGYLSKHDVPGVGSFIVQPEKVVYTFDDDALDLRANAWNTKFKFPSDRIRDDMKHLFPVFDRIEPNELWFKKSASELNLADVINFLGSLPPKHVAWVMSRLYNLACYLSISNMAHVDISLQNLYADTAKHSVHLYGGWWFGRSFDTKALGAPKWVTGLSKEFASTGIPTRRLVSQQIKEVGKLLLGATSPGSLMQNKNVPSAMTTWLLEPCSLDPIKEYATWGRCLEASFGPRKFVPLILTEKDIY